MKKVGKIGVCQLQNTNSELSVTSEQNLQSLMLMFDVETYPNTYFTKKIAKFQVVFILTTFNILTYLVTPLKLTTGLLTGYKPRMPCLFFGLSPNQSINSFEQLFSLWNVSEYGVFSGPYLDNFHAVFAADILQQERCD